MIVTLLVTSNMIDYGSLKCFISLWPLVTPQSVHGLGGSTVQATGIGVIKVAKGSFMLLEPALFILTSTVRCFAGKGGFCHFV